MKYDDGWIAWLEKQGEQNHAECNNSILKEKLLELFQRFRWYCKDKTPTNGDIIDYVDAHIQELIDTTQKLAWSEEDVAMLDSAIAFVEHSPFTTIGKGKGGVVAWLKSLKERYTWKPSEG